MSYAGGKKAKGGRTADLKGVNVVVTAFVNGEPRTQLELLEGFQKIPFGAGVPCIDGLASSQPPLHCSTARLVRRDDICQT